jgi:hypothetical protein
MPEGVSSIVLDLEYVTLTPVYPNVRPDLPVQEGGFHILPLKSIILRNFDLITAFVALILQPIHYEGALFLSKEGSRLRKIVECEIGDEGNNYCQDPFENKDPSGIISTLNVMNKGRIFTSTPQVHQLHPYAQFQKQAVQKKHPQQMPH